MLIAILAGLDTFFFPILLGLLLFLFGKRLRRRAPTPSSDQKTSDVN